MDMTASTPVNSSAGWQTIELTDSNSLYEEGETVWLAWVFENNPGLRYTSGTPGKAVSSQYWAGQMPSEFGSSSSSSYKYSICANYAAKYQQQEIELTGNPYMFTARAYDIETGLYYYRARYYNPYIGRFLQIDPAGHGMNMYAYCGNNSVNYTDPMGLYAYPIHIPLRTIWNDPVCINSNGDRYENTALVQTFLDDALFAAMYPGVTLTSGIYNEATRSFHCVFEVPDGCDMYSDLYSGCFNMHIIYENSIPILTVKSGSRGNRKSVTTNQILDYRLREMLAAAKKPYATASDWAWEIPYAIGEGAVEGFIGELNAVTGGLGVLGLPYWGGVEYGIPYMMSETVREWSQEAGDPLLFNKNAFEYGNFAYKIAWQASIRIKINQILKNLINRMILEPPPPFEPPPGWGIPTAPLPK